MAIEFVRLLRTGSSERFLLRRGRDEFGALDIHYLSDNVHATLVLFEEHQPREDAIPLLLTEIDELLLPEVRLDSNNLFFTVVIGRVLGSYRAEQADTGSQAS